MAYITIYGCALALLGLLIVVIRSMMFDTGFQSEVPHGQCEARLGYRMGMMVTCGKKTNHFGGEFWYCSEHPPK